MNREDIIRMAREAGIDWSGKSTEGVLVRAMQVAYAAGAAAEQAKFSDDLIEYGKAMAATEREACAQIVEQGHYAETRAGHAAAIRARSKQ